MSMPICRAAPADERRLTAICAAAQTQAIPGWPPDRRPTAELEQQTRGEEFWVVPREGVPAGLASLYGGRVLHHL
jgi:hypothetical protein